MNANSNKDQLMIRYLLDDLPEEEQRSLEDQYFADDALFEELIIVEDELIDAYVRDKLSLDERKRFEKHFLMRPQLAERVRFACALTNYTATAAPALSAVNEINVAESAAPNVDRKSARSWQQVLRSVWRVEQPIIQVALATLIVATMLGIPWLIFKRAARPEKAARVEQHSQNQRDEQLQQENGQQAPARISEVPPAVSDQSPPTIASSPSPIPKQPSNRAPQTNKPTPPVNRLPNQRRLNVVTLALVAGSVRDTGESNKLRLTPKVDVVELKLTLEADNFVRYNAVLQTAEGAKIWSANNLQARRVRSGSTSAKQLRVRIPARRLTPNDYILTINGTSTAAVAEVIAEYSLRIEK